MPFTLSHAAAVLPFRRYAARYTSLCALVIGSMSPDFVYFFKLGVNGGFSHSLAGMFLFCVPASLLVYIAYYLLLRGPLAALLPEAIAARLDPQPPWAPASLSSILTLTGSLLLGAATHIGWDAFTHANTFVVRHVAALRMPVSIGNLTLPLFNVLQHASSVLGLTALAVCAHRWMQRTPPQFVWHHRLADGKRAFVIAAILMAGAGGVLAGLVTRPARTVGHQAFNGVVGGMAWMMLAMLIFAAGWQVLVLRQGRVRRH